MSEKLTSTVSTEVSHIDGAYRYIVIGGGTAGCPLAATLAKKGKTLLLERGPATIKQPKYRTCCVQDAVTWHRTEAGSWAVTASVLGGGSAINAGVFVKESMDGPFMTEHSFLDFDLVRQTYDEVAQVFSHERMSSNRFQNDIVEAMKCAALGDKDIKTDTKHIGIYHPNTTFDRDGQRISAARILPGPNDASFSNLTVRTGVIVERLIFAATEKEPRAIGIEFRETETQDAIKQTLILPGAHFFLSGGAIHTPKLLLLSGIGDSEQLAKLKIPVVHHNPEVGKHLRDRSIIAVSVPSQVEVAETLLDTVATTPNYTIGSASGGQIAAKGIPMTLALLPKRLRTARNRQIATTFMRMVPRRLKKRINQQIVLFSVLANPQSEGRIGLKSNDPNGDLSVYTAGFQDSRDVDSITSGIKTIQAIINSQPFDHIRYDTTHHGAYPFVVRKVARAFSRTGPRLPTAEASSLTLPLLPSLEDHSEVSSTEDDCSEKVTVEEEKGLLKKWLNSMHTEGWSYAGTCRFGDVVNYDFTVKGVQGLSIVDASAFRRPTSVNSAATMMMLGVYAGKLVV